MTLIRPLMTSVQTTARADCAAPARRPLPPPIKSLAHWLSAGESQVSLCRCLVHPSPPQLLPASKIKHTFLSTNHVRLLTFKWWAAGLYFPLHFLWVPTGCFLLLWVSSPVMLFFFFPVFSSKAVAVTIGCSFQIPSPPPQDQLDHHLSELPAPASSVPCSEDWFNWPGPLVWAFMFW